MVAFRRPTLIGGNTTGVGRPTILGFGQSNYQSGKDISTLPVDYQQVYENVKFYQHSASFGLKFANMNWQDNTTYQSPDQNTFYALQFALYPAIAAQIGKPTHFVTHGIGDTGLYLEWKPTATVGIRYTEFIFKIKSYRNAVLAKDGIEPDFKFVLMDQGEKDGRDATNAGNYETNLTNLINGVRTAAGTTVPFLIAKFNPDIANASVNPVDFWATIDTAKDNVAAAMTDVFTVSMSNTEMDTDHIHRTPAGYVTAANNFMTKAIAEGLI